MAVVRQATRILAALAVARLHHAVAHIESNAAGLAPVGPALPHDDEAFLMSVISRDLLDTFPNPFPQRDYVIETICPEFTSMCPVTGQPDFGVLTLTYIPDKTCYELKSLKLYLQQYRNHGAFYESVTNLILDDVVAVTQPRWMKLEAQFTPRGGIRTNVTVEYRMPGSS